ncbi:SDR family oxidoreductase [Nocardioides sp.]|uniref:SDR family oxidoreductase n=1 Tax=Nocardioides sp. TaxID=35761 RepID=UPI002B27B460|nr:SDR family oxidoreductase [Nocardioides sp.]
MTHYPPIELSGAAVLVTGGAQGIGKAVATRLAARGAKVAIGDLDADLARTTAAAIGGTGHALDVRDPESFAAFVVEAEAAHGPVDVLVNNAGVMPNGAFLDLSDATNRMIMEVNVFGVIHGMRLVLPGMVARGRGHVCNIASLAGKMPLKGLAVYNASKFAVVGLTAATRLEYAATGVSIGAVLPSAVDTALSSGIDFSPLPKVSPDKIAEAVEASISRRTGEIAVPRYVGALTGVMNATPEPALNVVRRLVRDDRALHAEDADRAAYQARLAAEEQDAHSEQPERLL